MPTLTCNAHPSIIGMPNQLTFCREVALKSLTSIVPLVLAMLAGMAWPASAQDIAKQCEGKLRCEVRKLDGECHCRKAIANLTKQHGHTPEQVAQMRREKCASGQYDVQRCWTGPDPVAERSMCVAAVEGAGLKLPARKPGACAGAPD